jgi:toxin secretion/phage lysis holin
MNATKAAAAAFFGAITAFVGWRTLMILVLLALMCLDYFSGTMAARQNGTWKSEKARNGIGHKLGMALIVLVCIIADWVMIEVCKNLPNDVLAIEWPVVIFPMVTIWYILTEIGSIIENAMAMGAPVPSWLPKIIGLPLQAVDAVGDIAAAAEPKAEETAVPVYPFEDDDRTTSGLLD